MRVTRWQAEALRSLTGAYDFLLYDCENSRPARRQLRHAAYYFLNLFTVRNPWTRSQPLPADLPVVATTGFDSVYRGSWQSLPDELLRQIRRDQPVAIVKFGMGLLEIPPNDQLAVPILSYHHGNPERFRGRPAGLHEMLSDSPVVGQVVQRLSNTLDAGDILAFAETKTLAHSYRATLVEAYRHSPLLLRQAVANCIAGRSRTPASWGKNFRLPGNLLVLRFLFKQWCSAARRLTYGLVQEKRWAVATTGVTDEVTMESLTQALTQSANWRVLPTPPACRFIADPFFHPTGGLLVEGLNRRSSRGEILHVAEGTVCRLSGYGGHYSYPATILDDGRWWIVPEISDWSAAHAFPLAASGLGEAVELRIPGRPRLLDPTVFRHGGSIYLFANLATEGASVLRLWSAPGIPADFVEHPASPILISPNGARMGGNLCRIDGKLIRVGQDLSRRYGDGLRFFEITEIDQHRYREQEAGLFRFEHCRGPHTLNLEQGRAAFDFYVECFAPLAGIRRLREKYAARRPA